MKINDLLMETVQDDQAISTIATEITDYIKDNSEDFELNSKAIPISELIDFDPTDDSIEKLLAIKIEFGHIEFGHIGPNNAFGVYKHATKTIKINSEFLDMQLWDSIETNIVHELRHALDDIKSKGKLYKSKHLPRYRSARNSDDINSAPAEINARLQQAQHRMKGKIKRLSGIPTSSELTKIIFKCLKRYDLLDYFPEGTADPAFKRIVGRMYRYARP